MITTIESKIVRDDIRMDADVVYMQAPDFGGLTTHPLKLSVVYHKTPDIDFMEDNGGKAGVCENWIRSENIDNYPCIIWICGGGWTITDRFVYIPNLIPLVHSGFVLVSVEYLGNNAARFPSQICELKSAVRFIRKNALRYHIDPNRIGVMGESAGGYYTNMLAATNGYTEFDCGENLDVSSDVQAACCWYGPEECTLDERCGIKYMHYLSMSGAYNGIPEEIRQRANPTMYLSGKTPPVMIVHGVNDTCVELWRGEEWYNDLEKSGVHVEMLKVLNAGHADLRFFQPDVLDRIVDFFKRNM